jgi:glycerol-1-phosphate dehydrogenase [NAD(P)+]
MLSAEPHQEARSMHVDPTDIAAINRMTREWALPSETIHPVAIDRVVVAQSAVDRFVHAVEQAAGAAPVLLVQDTAAMTRAGDDLKPMLADRLRRVCKPLVLALNDAVCDAWLGGDERLPDSQTAPSPREFHATLPLARRLGESLGDFAAIVSIGSGSITDIAKYARHLHAERTGAALPFICFPTAASVTAYTSALAVLTVDGVKRTLPARPPDTVICDLQTLVDAPRKLTQAGFADVLARSVSAGDWWLSHQLGMDDSFSEAPIKLLQDAEDSMLHNAAGVARGGHQAVHAVTEALLLAGMAMSIVNQTAPLSGWEHVISHFLDLTAAADRRETALHGAQVGVGTLVSARAYESALEQFDIGLLANELYRPDEPGLVRRALAEYAFDESLLAEIERDLVTKAERWRGARPRRLEFIDRWRAAEITTALRDRVRDPTFIAEALRRAGAPCSCDALDHPVPDNTARNAVAHAHLIRARFTLGDLLAAGGWLSDCNIRALTQP